MPAEPTSLEQDAVDFAITGRPITDVDKILNMLVNPRECRDLIRYNNGTNGAPTLMYKPQNDFTYDYTTVASSASQQIPGNEAFFVLRKDVVCPLIFFNANPAVGTWIYNWRDISTKTIQFLTPTGFTTCLSPYWGNSDPAATFVPHGAILPAFRSKKSPYRYMWADHWTRAAPSSADGVFVITTVNAADAATNVVTGYFVNLYEWDGTQDRYVSTTSVAIGTSAANITIPNRGGYFRIEALNQDTGLAGCHVSSSGTVPVFAHVSVDNLSQIQSTVTAERLLTVAMKITNASADGFRAGMLYSADVYNGQVWQSLNLGSIQVGALLSVRTRPARNGFYGFPRIEIDDDFEMVNQLANYTNLLNRGDFDGEVYADLDQDTPYKVVSFIIPPPGTFPTDRFFNVELTSIIEGMGNTDLIAPQFGDATPQQWQAAVLLMSSIPSDYENITHWRDILAAIGKVGEVVTPALATQLRTQPNAVAQFLGNVVAPVVQAGFSSLKGLKRKKKNPPMGMIQQV